MQFFELIRAVVYVPLALIDVVKQESWTDRFLQKVAEHCAKYSAPLSHVYLLLDDPRA